MSNNTGSFGNASGVIITRVDKHDDMIIYDHLPTEYRKMLQDSPIDVAACDVYRAWKEFNRTVADINAEIRAISYKICRAIHGPDWDKTQ